MTVGSGPQGSGSHGPDLNSKVLRRSRARSHPLQNLKAAPSATPLPYHRVGSACAQCRGPTPELMALWFPLRLPSLQVIRTSQLAGRKGTPRVQPSVSNPALWGSHGSREVAGITVSPESSPLVHRCSPSGAHVPSEPAGKFRLSTATTPGDRCRAVTLSQREQQAARHCSPTCGERQGPCPAAGQQSEAWGTGCHTPPPRGTAREPEHCWTPPHRCQR